MNTPHVTRLRYKVFAAEGVNYNAPPPLAFDSPFFRGTLSDNVLDCEMTQHFPNESDAREVVEDFLRSWEIDAGIKRARPELRFQFWKAEIVDLDPTPNTVRSTIGALGVALRGVVSVSGDLALQVNAAAYPSPPRGFTATALVRTLWTRYVKYQEGREPLLSMAYFCLTALESDAGSRVDAATKYKIHANVLRKLGELTSTRGDSATARKASGALNTIPLSGQESAWIEAAVLWLIRRAGEVATGGDPSPLQMSELPPL